MVGSHGLYINKRRSRAGRQYVYNIAEIIDAKRVIRIGNQYETHSDHVSTTMNDLSRSVSEIIRINIRSGMKEIINKCDMNEVHNIVREATDKIINHDFVNQIVDTEKLRPIVRATAPIVMKEPMNEQYNQDNIMTAMTKIGNKLDNTTSKLMDSIKQINEAQCTNNNKTCQDISNLIDRLDTLAKPHGYSTPTPESNNTDAHNIKSSQEPFQFNQIQHKVIN